MPKELPLLFPPLWPLVYPSITWYHFKAPLIIVVPCQTVHPAFLFPSSMINFTLAMCLVWPVDRVSSWGTPPFFTCIPPIKPIDCVSPWISVVLFVLMIGHWSSILIVLPSFVVLIHEGKGWSVISVPSLFDAWCVLSSLSLVLAVWSFLSCSTQTSITLPPVSDVIFPLPAAA